MKLIAAHVFESRGIGRATEESGEVLDPLHVVMLGLRRQLADRHVFDHALPQRAYGLIGHEGCSCLDGGCEPLISRQDAASRYRVGSVARRGELPRERFSPLDPSRTLPQRTDGRRLAKQYRYDQEYHVMSRRPGQEKTFYRAIPAGSPVDAVPHGQPFRMMLR